MHRAFSFPVTVERSRTKDRLEASLAGLCELELRKQRQECRVLDALALGDPLVPDSDRDDSGCFSSWGKDNLTLRRQLVRSLSVSHSPISKAISPRGSCSYIVLNIPASNPSDCWMVSQSGLYLLSGSDLYLQKKLLGMINRLSV